METEQHNQPDQGGSTPPPEAPAAEAPKARLPQNVRSVGLPRGQGASSQAQTDEGPDGSNWDDETRSYIAKLRGEAADRRVANKGLEGKLEALTQQNQHIMESLGIEDVSNIPLEQQVEHLSGHVQEMQFNNLVLQSAIQNGVGAEHLDYFNFLVTQHTESMEEGDEFTEEALAEILTKVKSVGGGSATTSIPDGNTGGATPPAEGSQGDVNLEQFNAMTTSEKSKLYVNNRSLYDSLLAQSKQSIRRGRFI